MIRIRYINQKIMLTFQMGGSTVSGVVDVKKKLMYIRLRGHYRGINIF